MEEFGGVFGDGVIASSNRALKQKRHMAQAGDSLVSWTCERNGLRISLVQHMLASAMIRDTKGRLRT